MCLCGAREQDAGVEVPDGPKLAALPNTALTYVEARPGCGRDGKLRENMEVSICRRRSRKWTEQLPVLNLCRAVGSRDDFSVNALMSGSTAVLTPVPASFRSTARAIYSDIGFFGTSVRRLDLRVDSLDPWKNYGTLWI